MRYTVQPGGELSGELVIPGDKSISHRALMIGSIATGRSEITGFLAGEDCLATLAALQRMGVGIERPQQQHVIVHGEGMAALKSAPAPLDMGNAGTAMRLFMGLLAPRAFDSTLIGDASLMRRPMERVAVPLREMGAGIDTLDGRPPVRIHGGRRLHAIEYRLPVASAQVKSALLLAGLQVSGRTCITEPVPTRDHTERMLRSFGAALPQQGTRVAIEGGQVLRGTQIRVPGDFSSAAFFLVAGCLAADRGLLLRNVGVNPTRTGLLELLRAMGADIRVHARPEGASAAAESAVEPTADLEIFRSRLHGIEVPESLVPLAIDEFPAFFIAAACAEGVSCVRGASELRLKESDRLAGMAAGLAALGVPHELHPDGLRIEGVREFSAGTIDSRADHRLAMAFAIAGLRARGELTILDVANVATSFPGFEAVARAAGLRIQSA